MSRERLLDRTCARHPPARGRRPTGRGACSSMRSGVANSWCWLIVLEGSTAGREPRFGRSDARFARAPAGPDADNGPDARAVPTCRTAGACGPPMTRCGEARRRSAASPYNPRCPAKQGLRPMALLEIRNVTRRFGDFTAVDDVSFDVKAGEFFTLLGPSGCGKTTLLRMIAGFDLPDEGSIVLDGEDLADTPPEKRPIHTVFQSYALFPHMTVAAERRVPAQDGRRRRRRRSARRSRATLEHVKLDGKASGFPHELSGGQKQRVALARGARQPPARAAARRAARRARRQAARADADRAHPPAEGRRRHVRVRHARRRPRRSRCRTGSP